MVYDCGEVISKWLAEIVQQGKDPFESLDRLWNFELVKRIGGVGLFSCEKAVTITLASVFTGVPNGWQAGYWSCPHCGSTRFKDATYANAFSQSNNDSTPENPPQKLKIVEAVCDMGACASTHGGDAVQVRTVHGKPGFESQTFRTLSHTTNVGGSSNTTGRTRCRLKAALFPPYMARRDEKAFIFFVNDNGKGSSRSIVGLRKDAWVWDIQGNVNLHSL